MVILKQSFPFIYDDVFLTACVNTKNNYTYVLLEKINPKTKEVEFTEEISCIHTVVYIAPCSKIQTMREEGILQKKMLDIRSSEFMVPVDLAPEEQFFALKSWVQGICEADLDSFLIQSHIEEYSNLLFPLTEKLLSFLLKVEPRIIPKLLRYIKKKCIFESKPHYASLNANIMPILDILILDEGDIGIFRSEEHYRYSEEYFHYFHNNFEEYLEQIIELQPSVLLFLNRKYKFLVETDKRIQKLPDYIDLKRNYSVKCNGKRYWAYYSGHYLVLNLPVEIKSIEQIQGLERLQNLEVLSIPVSGITNIDGLDQLHNLRHLYLSYNNIESCNGLKYLTNLRELSLSSNSIKETDPLINLVNLESLDLSYNPIVDVSPLSQMRNLWKLQLNGTLIRSTRNLGLLEKLRYLEIGSPKLNIIEGLEKSINLRTLILKSPSIDDVEDILRIPNLRNLSILEDSIKENDKKKLLYADFHTNFLV